MARRKTRAARGAVPLVLLAAGGVWVCLRAAGWRGELADADSAAAADASTLAAAREATSVDRNTRPGPALGGARCVARSDATAGSAGAAQLELVAVEPDGTPIADAEVAVGMAWCGALSSAEREANVLARTGPDGHARFELPEGADAIAVRAPMHGIGRAELPAPASSPAPSNASVEDRPLVVVLPRAQRLEIELDGASDPRGWHVEVGLSSEFVQREFFVTELVWSRTAGRSVGDASAAWREDEQGARWSLAFDPRGRAVLDQLADRGTVTASLRYFDEEFDRREARLVPGGITRLVLRAPPVPAPHVLQVLDAEGRAAAGARVDAIVRSGLQVVGSHLPGGSPQPHWAPGGTTDAEGRFVLPRPLDPAARVYFEGEGLARRVLTIAELEALAGRVSLSRELTLRLQLVGRDGGSFDGGWSTIGRFFAEPLVHVGHDVWAAPEWWGELPVGGDPCDVPCFFFRGLPAGVLEFRCRELPWSDVWYHEARADGAGVPEARFESSKASTEVPLGQ